MISIKLILIFSSIVLTGKITCAQFSTAYVSSGSTYHIENNQGTGTYKTNRSSTPGYFTAKGTAQYLNATDTYHINGYAAHIPTSADQGYIFQVGSGTDLRTLAISGNRPSNAVVGTAWIIGDPTTNSDPTNGNAYHPITSLGPDVVEVANVGQWDWIAPASAAGITATVSIPDLTSYINFTAPNTRLVGWNGTQWINLGSAGTAALTEGNTLQGTVPAGIDAIAIGRVSAILPANGLDFDGAISNCNVRLSWKVKEEINLSHYEVERSIDGFRFIKIANYPAKGMRSTYDHTDFSIQEGSYYYRLKMVDLDNTIKYSNKTIHLKTICGSQKITVFPNPTNNKINVQGLQNGNTIYIHNLLGQLVKSVTGGKNAQIDLSQLPAGIYSLIIKNGQTTISVQKIIRK